MRSWTQQQHILIVVLAWLWIFLYHRHSFAHLAGSADDVSATATATLDGDEASNSQNRMMEENTAVYEIVCSVDDRAGSADSACNNMDTIERSSSSSSHDDDNDNTPNCEDTHPECAFWASLSECDHNPAYMKQYCRLSCGTCNGDDKEDNSSNKNNNNKSQNFNDAISKNKVENAYRLQQSALERSGASARIGVPQVLNGDGLGVSVEQILEVVDKALAYVEQDVHHVELLELCKNRHELCAVWAAMGECDANPMYMMESACAPVCQSCHRLTIEGRCPIDPNSPRAWEPGSLQQMFERLTSEPYLSDHKVEILSSPALNDGPWIITLEDVITSDEADRLIELGEIEGYKESLEVEKVNADGTLAEKRSAHRTSFNSWCQHDCYRDEVAQRVIHRLSSLTGIDEANSEYLQLLRYEPGQYYLPHHDFIPTDVERQQGPRILTVFLYLNGVEAGGETEFTTLGQLQVTPKKLRALIWPNVLNDDPRKVDDRTQHQALRVKAGVKYGANAWFHLHDFKTPNRNKCQG